MADIYGEVVPDTQARPVSREGKHYMTTRIGTYEIIVSTEVNTLGDVFVTIESNHTRIETIASWTWHTPERQAYLDAQRRGEEGE